MKAVIKVMRAVAVLTLVALPAAAQSFAPTKIRVNGVDLVYIEQGQGETVILLHGGAGDYRSWGSQIDALNAKYRVISYSRRYHYPNDNPITSKYRGAFTEADDLAAFIHRLKLKRVHLIGTSIGAFTALVFAVKHPEMVVSLVLAEPPIHEWVKDTPAGLAAYNDFMTTIWKPAGDAFRSGDDTVGMRIMTEVFGGAGSFERLPTAARTAAMQNSRFFKAATSLSDPFPNLSKDKVRRLKMPILLIRGENTIPIHRLVIDELGRLLPDAEKVIILKAGHGSPRENPQAFNDAVIRFLSRK